MGVASIPSLLGRVALRGITPLGSIVGRRLHWNTPHAWWWNRLLLRRLQLSKHPFRHVIQHQLLDLPLLGFAMYIVHGS